MMILTITFNDRPLVSIGSNNANTVNITQLDKYIISVALSLV